jgi:hypothetical protein
MEGKMIVKHTNLCIGGPNAGQRIKVSPNQVILKTTVYGQESTEIVTYTRQMVCVSLKDAISFWIPKTQTPMETFELLFEAYEKNLDKYSSQEKIK